MTSETSNTINHFVLSTRKESVMDEYKRQLIIKAILVAWVAVWILVLNTGNDIIIWIANIVGIAIIFAVVKFVITRRK